LAGGCVPRSSLTNLGGGTPTGEKKKTKTPAVRAWRGDVLGKVRMGKSVFPPGRGPRSYLHHGAPPLEYPLFERTSTFLPEAVVPDNGGRPACVPPQHERRRAGERPPASWRTRCEEWWRQSGPPGSRHGARPPALVDDGQGRFSCRTILHHPQSPTARVGPGAVEDVAPSRRRQLVERWRGPFGGIGLVVDSDPTRSRGRPSLPRAPRRPGVHAYGCMFVAQALSTFPSTAAKGPIIQGSGAGAARKGGAGKHRGAGGRLHRGAHVGRGSVMNLSRGP